MIVRRDLPVGVLAVNVLHAAGESAGGLVDPWTHGLVLAAADLADLERLAVFGVRKGLSLVRIVETDGPYAGQLMAIGVQPGPRDVIRKVYSSAPMLRE